ncbi:MULTISPECIES: bifunctional adenosylcobinamide kinase/adenosylcobinamide-phosphate guanylyltransferase [unclassified Beijerinckia]|uniref:bifunctional adenosylcobinamide kinase/adenosylcobinamide-phosphate guanylyltransferase n=1 Tax=unclassified Beijerinckia TaxID=2638183 RepID=UPI000896BAF4|nr:MULTISPECIES: bifunctional adenosylcobinamide kinase/adenosylcobinamide-phosphate guanylyltransferase [unclassified Beijerinckia]MDH7797943.1 adenosylcobinamide kinase/adenosylcobinamide-phosphate guanylyltransferase [Beijerinckia sp. GAS462]SED03598.1 adenosylcobinamide kinase /adenosylcobinamide-phosphate guanylyltransferase [Beijerinckia sp. 28-YEA-48]
MAAQSTLATQATLVLGGARSGKSRFAQQLADASGLRKRIIVTATAGDAEMERRIAHHRAERAADWTTIEAPLALPEAITSAAAATHLVVVDCLTLWLANVMLAGHDVEAKSQQLTAAVAACPYPLVLVSNEVGFGIVPDTELGRAFRDAQGRLNQMMAATCAKVVLVVAGLPLQIKPQG